MADGDKPTKTRSKNPSYAGLTPASANASRAKRANRKTNTRHEIALRRAVWKLGLRYRKHVSELPGNPDLVFARARVAVFCDGDFWHGRNWLQLRSQLQRCHNGSYWIAKIARNRERDRENSALLESSGWLVMHLWETDIRKEPTVAALLIRDAIKARTGNVEKKPGKKPGDSSLYKPCVKGKAGRP
jgi:DNA mismatch endonuclease, patch repair protein